MVSVPIIVVSLLSMHGAGAVTPMGDLDQKRETIRRPSTHPAACETPSISVTARNGNCILDAISAGHGDVRAVRPDGAAPAQSPLFIGHAPRQRGRPGVSQIAPGASSDVRRRAVLSM
jgi:hypothetical protein